MQENTPIPEPTLLDQVKASPLIWFSVAFLCGILLGPTTPGHFYIWIVAAVAILAFGWIASRIDTHLPLALLLLPGMLALGVARYQAQPLLLPADAVSRYNDQSQHITLSGIVSEAPDIRDKVVNIRLQAKSLLAGEVEHPVSGDVLVKLYNEQDLHYGDLISVTGLLVTPPVSADFSYRDYLAGQGILSMLTTSEARVLTGSTPSFIKATLINLQDALYQKTQELFQPPVASLVAGILIGRDENIPKNVDQAFTDTGTSHIVAISGFNIGIVAFIFILVFGRLFGKRNGTIISIAGILFYMILAGAGASLVRAAIMGVLGAVGVLLGRRNATITALFLAALVMALIDPNVLAQVGFQLSFSATFGIVALAQPLQQMVRNVLQRIAPAESVDTLLSILSDIVIITLAAQAGVLPFILYHFGRLPLVTFIANPLVLPLQPLLMIFSGLAVMLGFVFLPAAQLFTLLAHPLGAATIGVVELLAPYSAWNINFGNFSTLFVLLYYVVLLAILFAWPTLSKQMTPAVIIPILLLMVFLAWDAVAKLPDGKLHVLVMDVGSADAILVTTPSGHQVLSNGGDTPSALLDQVGRHTSIFHRQVDLLIIASTQENQLAALPRFVGIFPPEQVLWAGNSEASFSSMKLNDLLLKKGYLVQAAVAGQTIDLGDGAQIRVLAVSTRGAVLRLQMGGFGMLLPIGVNSESFKQLADEGLISQATVVNLAESGYGPSNPVNLLKMANPQYYTVGVSAFDTRGLPSPALLQALDNDNVLQTGKNGWIEISTDGSTTQVTSAR